MAVKKRIELKIRNPNNIYRELVQALYPYRYEDALSVEFIVEGGLNNPIVGIRYPGEKVKFREGRVRVKWANLYDFLVVPYRDGAECNTADFTFEKLLHDYYQYKKDSDVFWKLVRNIYYKNIMPWKPPYLPGIYPVLFLLTLKWMWIQEDLNYKLDWNEVGSPEKYIRLSRRGKRVGKGAGRAKFFAVLILVRHEFTLEEIKKIIPLYA